MSKYTKEELKEFGRQKGRISGYMTKYSIKGWGKDIEEFADELPLCSPKEHFAGKKVDKRYRQHISDHSHRQCRPVVQSHADGNRDRSPQFHDRHHGYQGYQQILFQHRVTLLGNFPNNHIAIH